MPARFYDDPLEFEQAVRPALLANEAGNSLPLGVLAAIAGPQREARCDPGQRQSSEPPLLVAIEACGQVVAALVQTPPRAVLLSAAPIEAAASLAEALRERGIRPQSVVGPDAAAVRFADELCAGGVAAARRVRSMRLFELREVRWPQRCPGSFSGAREGDVDDLARWLRQFCQEHGEPLPADACAAVREGIDSKSAFVWRDGGPLAMAWLTRPLVRTISISRVYTPPAQRGRGYASNLVAALSAHALRTGWKSCLLFTDLANPVSNAIYQRVGYAPLGDFAEIALEWSDASAAARSA